MLAKRLVAILVGLALIVMSVIRPAPARATSVAEDVGIAFAALGAWVIVVVAGTWAVYGPPWSSLNQDANPDSKDLGSRRGLRFGVGCQPVPGSPQPLACW